MKKKLTRKRRYILLDLSEAVHAEVSSSSKQTDRSMIDCVLMNPWDLQS